MSSLMPPSTDPSGVTRSSETTLKGLRLIFESLRNSMYVPPAFLQSFSNERPRSIIHTRAPLDRYDQAISFISTDLPEPGAPMIEKL